MAHVVIGQGYASTSELAVALGVSEMTIRRDVAQLEREGRVRTVHGGVAATSEVDLGGSEFEVRTRLNAIAKRALARAAIDLLPAEGAIAIDAGTTAAGMVSLLPADRSFTLVTYSLPVMTEAARLPNVELINLGGLFHRNSLSYSGAMTVRAIEHLSISTFFLGTSSISDRGLFCGNEFDAVTKRALIDVAEKVVLLADSSKFSKIAMVRFCDFAQLDEVIVDSGIDAASLKLLRSADLEPVVVSGES